MLQRHINLAQHLSTFTSKPSFLGQLDMEHTIIEAQSYDMWVVLHLFQRIESNLIWNLLMIACYLKFAWLYQCEFHAILAYLCVCVCVLWTDFHLFWTCSFLACSTWSHLCYVWPCMICHGPTWNIDDLSAECKKLSSQITISQYQLSL